MQSCWDVLFDNIGPGRTGFVGLMDTIIIIHDRYNVRYMRSPRIKDFSGSCTYKDRIFPKTEKRDGTVFNSKFFFPLMLQEIDPNPTGLVG